VLPVIYFNLRLLGQFVRKTYGPQRYNIQSIKMFLECILKTVFCRIYKKCYLFTEQYRGTHDARDMLGL